MLDEGMKKLERRSGKEDLEIHFTNFASSPLTGPALFASRPHQTLLPTAQ